MQWQTELGYRGGPAPRKIPPAEWLGHRDDLGLRSELECGAVGVNLECTGDADTLGATQQRRDGRLARSDRDLRLVLFVGGTKRTPEVSRAVCERFVERDGGTNPE